jgi:hypothetical protein
MCGRRVHLLVRVAKWKREVGGQESTNERTCMLDEALRSVKNQTSCEEELTFQKDVIGCRLVVHDEDPRG